MTPPPWLDWFTKSQFRIRVAPPAAEKLVLLRPDLQQRLQQMMQDIAELAEMMPPSKGQTWREGDSEQLLHLRVGKVDVRYSISDASRTLTIEHVVVPQTELDQA